MQNELCFRLNDEPIQLDAFEPTATLLDFIREQKQLKGTKEGCNEGDCGACTVSLGRIRDGKLSYEPVNACILLVGQIDGADVITVDDLAEDNALHPVQQSMVDVHASQCGFCTPGMVMSALSIVDRNKGKTLTDALIRAELEGNLCRCTGYQAIVKSIAAGAVAMDSKVTS